MGWNGGPGSCRASLKQGGCTCAGQHVTALSSSVSSCFQQRLAWPSLLQGSPLALLFLEFACALDLDGALSVSLILEFPLTAVQFGGGGSLCKCWAGYSEHFLWPSACIPRSLLWPVIRPSPRRLCGQSSPKLLGL